MAWLEDAIDEFKKLPPAGKVAAVGAVVAAAGIGFYEYKKGQAGQPITPALTTDTAGSVLPPDTGASSGGATQPAPVPTPVSGPVSPPKPPQKNPPKPPPPPKLNFYTVVHGDTLSGIAARLHIKGGWQALYNKNRGVVGSNPNLIYPGERLNITGLV